MAEPVDRRGDAERYTVRRYRDDDRSGVLSLYEAAGMPRSPEWFASRFEHNPCLSHVPVFVATDDGAVVGALSVAAVRLWTPDEPVLGLRVGDPLVRPDADHGNLPTRLASACADHYADGDTHVRFRFGDPAADTEWFAPDARVAGDVPTYYRVQRPGALVGDGRWGWLAAAADPAAAGYLEARDRLAMVPDDATVHRYTDLPLARLWTLYRRAVPDTLHAIRDPAYYRWRFADPEQPATTYVATLDGDPAAAVVTYEETAGRGRCVKIADFVPLRPTRRRTAAAKSLLAAVVEERADAALLVASGTLPAGALRAFGFHPDTALPLSAVTSPTALVVAPVSGRLDGDPDRWTLGGRSVDDAADWTVAFGVRDAA